MLLGELIQELEKYHPEHRVSTGFGNPHSYRGFYDDLAFEPVKDTTVSAMLESARSALGKTFTGYKGGEYVMTEYSTCWIAEHGRCGECIGPLLLHYMLDRIENCDAPGMAGQHLRPIETAPRDGTYVLLFGPSGYRSTPLRAEVGRYDPRYRPLSPWINHACDSFEDGGQGPTHWLPLPCVREAKQ